MPLIAELDVSGAQRTDSGLWSGQPDRVRSRHHRDLHELQHLRLNGIKVSPRGPDRIAGRKKLSRLALQSCSRSNDDVVPILKSFPALRVVDLTGAAVTDQGLAELHKACPTLASCTRISVRPSRGCRGARRIKTTAARLI